MSLLVGAIRAAHTPCGHCRQSWSEKNQTNDSRPSVHDPLRKECFRIVITWAEGQQNLELAPEQREAIRQAVTSKVLVITGGPGTGKTTLVNSIIRILEKKSRRIFLAAPTGRALWT